MVLLSTAMALELGAGVRSDDTLLGGVRVVAVQPRGPWALAGTLTGTVHPNGVSGLDRVLAELLGVPWLVQQDLLALQVGGEYRFLERQGQGWGGGPRLGAGLEGAIVQRRELPLPLLGLGADLRPDPLVKGDLELGGGLVTDVGIDAWRGPFTLRLSYEQHWRVEEVIQLDDVWGASHELRRSPTVTVDHVVTL